MSDIDSILNGEPEPAPEVEAPEPETGQPRDEHGRFANQAGDETEAAVVPDDAPPVEGPPPSEPEQGHIPVAALKDERAKRQQAEEQLRRYEQHFAELQAQQQAPSPQADLDPDTQAFFDLVQEQTLARLMPQIQQQMQQTTALNRAEVSEFLARQKYQDYDQQVEVFKQALEENPVLLGELQRAPDPADYAYQAARRYAEAKQYSQGPTAEQREAEIRAKIMAEIGVSRPTAPSSLASERSVGGRTGPAWSGPRSLGDLLG